MFRYRAETGPLFINVDQKSDRLEVTGGRVEGWATAELDGPPGKALAPTPAKPMRVVSGPHQSARNAGVGCRSRGGEGDKPKPDQGLEERGLSGAVCPKDGW